MRLYSYRPGDFKTPIRPVLLLFCLLLIPSNCFSAPKTERYLFRRIVMGVPFNLTLYAESEAVANQTQISVFKRLRELNLIFSDYDSESELSRLCANAVPGQAYPVSPELADVFEQSLKLSRESDGAFDISVGPIVKMWRKAKRKKEMPSPELIRKTGESVGYQNLKYNPERQEITFLKNGIKLDLGGIAKGYACDEALRICQENGITSALIDAGGDIVVSDPPPDKTGWKIGIASLAKPDESPTEFLIVSNCAVATSGDAYQYVEFDGKRYSHIVDPKTGIGLTRRFSVTVIAKNGTEADSLASAVSVLGMDKGIDLINRKKKSEVLVVEINGEHVVTKTSQRFQCFQFPQNCSQ